MVEALTLFVCSPSRRHVSGEIRGGDLPGSRCVILSNPMRRALFTILLILAPAAAAAKITGTIVDESGEPVRGARVAAFAPESTRAFRTRLLSSEERSPITTVETDAAGRFAIDHGSHAFAEVLVTAPDRSAVVLDLPAGEDAGIIVLRKAKSRTVRVTAGGKPLGGARVAFGRTRIAETNADGTIDVPADLADGPITIVHPEHPVTRHVPRERSRRSGAIEIAVGKSEVVRGRAVNADGTPAAGAAIDIDGYPIGTSADDGSFALAIAATGWRSVTARLGDRIATLRRGGACCTLKLEPAAAISGVAVDGDSGAPAAGVRVALTLPEGTESLFTNAKGEFSFTALAPGKVDLHGGDARWLASGPPSSHVFTAGKREQVRLVVERAPRVSGVVVDGKGAPLRGAFVSAFGTRAPFALALTDARGRFTTLGRRRMTYEVHAVRSGYAPGSAEVDAEAAEEITIRLERGFPLVVRVIDAAKEPVAGAMVRLTRIDENEGRMRGRQVPCPPGNDGCFITGDDGSASYLINEGTYDVTVAAEGTVTKRLARQQLKARSSPLTLVVERGVEISGRVVYTDGSPVREGIVRSRNPEGGLSARIGDDGTFRIGNAPRGPVTLIAHHTGPMQQQSAPKEIHAPATGVVLTMPRAGTIAGRVIDAATRQPVAEFSVRPLRQPGMMTQPVAVQSSDGRFAVDADSGRYTVQVTARGYAFGSIGGVEVSEGRTTEEIEVPLERGGRVAGRVTAPGGTPLSGVGVHIRSDTPGTPGERIATDADGRYAIESIAAGNRTITFMRSGYRPRREAVEIAAGRETQLDVEMDRGRELRGRVVDETGQPVGGAEVQTEGPDFARTRTKTDGAFALSGVAETRVTLRATRNGFVTAREAVEATANEVTLTLRRGGTITGRVTGLTEQELQRVRVFAAVPGSRATAEVDASGAFTMQGIPDGRITVGASLPGPDTRSAQPAVVDVRGGSAPPVEIAFTSGFTIRGRVTRNGAPVEGAMVAFRSSRGFGPGAPVRGGMYEVSGVPPGTYRVVVTADASEIWRGDYEVTGDATFDIDVRSGFIRGRTIDAATSAPVPGAVVALEAVERSGAWARPVATDATGRFSIEVTPGRYALRVQKSSYASVRREVDAGAPQEIEIALRRVEPTVIRVVEGRSGRPLVAHVVITDESRKQVFQGTSADDGIVRASLAPGSYTARVMAQGYAPAIVTVAGSGPEVRVELARGGALLVRSRSGAGVRARLTGGLAPVTVVSGRTFDGIPAGNYTLEILGEKAAVVERRPVVILEGQTTTVDVD